MLIVAGERAFVGPLDVVFHMDIRRAPSFWIFGGNWDIFPTLPYVGEGAPNGWDKFLTFSENLKWGASLFASLLVHPLFSFLTKSDHVAPIAECRQG